VHACATRELSLDELADKVGSEWIWWMTISIYHIPHRQPISRMDNPIDVSFMSKLPYRSPISISHINLPYRHRILSCHFGRVRRNMRNAPQHGSISLKERGLLNASKDTSSELWATIRQGVEAPHREHPAPDELPPRCAGSVPRHLRS
jgi:hypothetical protein